MARGNGTEIYDNAEEDSDTVNVFGLPFRMVLPIVSIGSFILALVLAFCCYMLRKKTPPSTYKEVVVKKGGKEDIFDSIKYSTCVICLEDFKSKDTLAIGPCDHVFHEKCLSKWLKRRRTCPVCMEEIKPDFVSGNSARRHRGTSDSQTYV